MTSRQMNLVPTTRLTSALYVLLGLVALIGFGVQLTDGTSVFTLIAMVGALAVVVVGVIGVARHTPTAR